MGLETGEWRRCRSLPLTPPASLRSHGSRPRPTRHTYVSVSHYGIRPFRVFLRSPITLRQPQLAGRRDVVSESGLPTPPYKRSDTTSLRHSKTSSRFTPEAFNELSDERLATTPFFARLLQFCIPADCKDCSILRWLQQRLVSEMLCDLFMREQNFMQRHTPGLLCMSWAETCPNGDREPRFL